MRTGHASPTRRALILACAVCVTALVLTACGGSSSSTSSAASPQAQVRQAWAHLKTDLVGGHAAAFCSILSAKASQEVITAMKKVGAGSSCDVAAAKLLALAKGERHKDAGAHLISVKVTGNTAVTTDSAGPPATHWMRVDGVWKVDDVQ